jgi:hypothetical protein
MNIGKFKIEAIETGLFGLDGGSMFGIVPKVLWQRNIIREMSKTVFRLLLVHYLSNSIIESF